MKCILVSFFNSNNLGDILIGEQLYDICKDYFEVKKISYSGDMTVNNNNSIQVSKKANKKTRVISFAKNMGFGKIYNFYKRKTAKNPDPYLENIIKEADLLIIGGGNMIFDLDRYSDSASRFHTFVDMAKKNDKQVMAISLGIGPFSTEEQAINAVGALSCCDYITFRDNASYNIFRQYNTKHKNVHVSIDPVFLLNRKIKYNKSNKGFVAINIINNKLLESSLKKYKVSINAYSKLVMNLAKSIDNEIVLFSTEGFDYEAIEDVYANLDNNNNISIKYIKTDSDLFDLYEQTNILIGTRMHAMIVAFTQNIPIVGLSWQEKVNSMFKIIDNSSSLFDYNKLEDNLDDIVFKVKCMIKDGNDILHPNITKQETLSKMNNINLEILDEIRGKSNK